MDIVFAVAGVDLFVVDLDAGNVLYRGRPDGFPVSRATAVPGSTDGLVLLDWDANNSVPDHNLLRCSPDGTVVWRAQRPADGHAFYQTGTWDGLTLVATTWPGRRVVLDAVSGQILHCDAVEPAREAMEVLREEGLFGAGPSDPAGRDDSG